MYLIETDVTTFSPLHMQVSLLSLILYTRSGGHGSCLETWIPIMLAATQSVHVCAGAQQASLCAASERQATASSHE